MANNVPFQSSVPATPSSATIVETIDQGGGVQRQVVQVGNTITATVSSATVTLSSAATVTPSSAISVNFVGIPSVSVASGTVTLSSNPTVIPSSAVQVTLTSNVVALSSVATVTPSSNITTTPSSVRTVTLSSAPAFALSSAIAVSSGTVTLSSNPTVTPSSAVQVTLTSNTVALSSAVTLSNDGWLINSAVLSSGTNSTLVKGSAGSLFKVESFNNSTTPGYLKIYNLSTAPTAGSSLVFLRLLVPGNTGGGGVVTEYSGGDTMTTGLGYTFTGGIADSDTTAVSAATYIVNIHYK